MSDSAHPIFIAPDGPREVVFEFQNHETDLTNKFLFSDGGSTRRFISAPPKVATPSPSLFYQTSTAWRLACLEILDITLITVIPLLVSLCVYAGLGLLTNHPKADYIEWFIK